MEAMFKEQIFVLAIPKGRHREFPPFTVHHSKWRGQKVLPCLERGGGGGHKDADP